MNAQSNVVAANDSVNEELRQLLQLAEAKRVEEAVASIRAYEPEESMRTDALNVIIDDAWHPETWAAETNPRLRQQLVQRGHAIVLAALRGMSLPLPVKKAEVLEAIIDMGNLEYRSSKDDRVHTGLDDFATNQIWSMAGRYLYAQVKARTAVEVDEAGNARKLASYMLKQIAYWAGKTRFAPTIEEIIAFYMYRDTRYEYVVDEEEQDCIEEQMKATGDRRDLVMEERNNAQKESAERWADKQLDIFIEHGEFFKKEIKNALENTPRDTIHLTSDEVERLLDRAIGAVEKKRSILKKMMSRARSRARMAVYGAPLFQWTIKAVELECLQARVMDEGGANCPRI